MPTYEYRCKSCGHELEAVQFFTDDPLTECPACTGPLRKVFGTIGVTFKGSGFCKTDSRSSSKKSAASTSGRSSSDGAGSDSSSSSSDFVVVRLVVVRFLLVRLFVGVVVGVLLVGHEQLVVEHGDLRRAHRPLGPLAGRPAFLPPTPEAAMASPRSHSLPSPPRLALRRRWRARRSPRPVGRRPPPRQPPLPCRSKSLDGRATARREAWGESEPVVVATHDLEAGVIGPGDVTVEQWPRGRPSGAITEVPTGQVVIAAVVDGEAVIGSPPARRACEGWRRSSPSPPGDRRAVVGCRLRDRCPTVVGRRPGRRARHLRRGGRRRPSHRRWRRRRSWSTSARGPSPSPCRWRTLLGWPSPLFGNGDLALVGAS